MCCSASPGRGHVHHDACRCDGTRKTIPGWEWAELGQAIFESCMDLLGPEATCYSGYDRHREPEDLGDGVKLWTSATTGDEDVQRMFLRSRAYTIEGGTSDILRNIVGERVLGLPGDLRADRDKPWTEVPRG